MKKVFKRFVSIILAITVGVAGLGLTPANATIDDCDGYFIYEEGDEGNENLLIRHLYDNLTGFFGRLRSVEDELDVTVPSSVCDCVASGGAKVESGEEFVCAENCISDFSKLLEDLCVRNFDDKYFTNILRLISISSILCITYAARYFGLLKHMLYILSIFSARSRMLNMLLRDDQETWTFVLGHISPYSATNLLLTADYLCSTEFDIDE